MSSPLVYTVQGWMAVTEGKEGASMLTLLITAVATNLHLLPQNTVFLFGQKKRLADKLGVAAMWWLDLMNTSSTSLKIE